MTIRATQSSADSEGKSKFKFFNALAKSRSSVFDKLTSLFSGSSRVDPEKIEELEDVLILSDIGYDMSTSIVDSVSATLKKSGLSTEQVFDVLQAELLKTMKICEVGFDLSRHPTPTVILMVGVNGVGKTTSCAKIAALMQQQGHSVMLAACDTFRAAAVEQLQTWGQRLNIPVIAQSTGADPAAVAHDAMHAATARQCSALLIDTAGRQQTRDDLMRQLNKIYRVIGKIEPSAPHETLITIDAGTGQNAISQVREFNQHTPISGICVSKLDGTAKGGIVVALAHEFSLPIAFIGLGEGINDIALFNADDYVASLLGTVPDQHPVN